MTSSTQVSEQPGRAWRAASNSVFGLIEFVWPIALALATTPIVVRGLGVDAYGVLAIVAVTLGFVGLLDLGIGGAAMRAVAQHLEAGEAGVAARVVGSVMTAYLVIGLLGALGLAAVTPLLVSTILTIPADLHPDATAAFYISAAGFPLTLLVGALASVPKAAQRFDLSTRVGVVFSTLASLTTVGVVVAGYGVPAIAIASLVLNAAAAVVYFRVSSGVLSGARIRLGADLPILRGLASFGGWFLVATIGVTVLYQLDKILVGSFLGVAAVTFYVVPGNLAGRIQGFLGAATQVVFPTSSALLALGRNDAVARLYRDGTRLTALLAATVAVPLAVFSRPFLENWMGPDFAEVSSVVLVLLVATYTLLGLTGVAWGLSFGAGRSKINAVFAVGMGGLDVALFLLLVGPLGIVGAAAAFLVSAAVGVPLFVIYVERRVLGLGGLVFLREYARALPAVAGQILVGVLLLLPADSLITTLAAMIATAAALPILYFALGLATATDRSLVARAISRVRVRRR